MEKHYTFIMTMQQAQVIVAALKKQPMEIVEPVVNLMVEQFNKQNIENIVPANMPPANNTAAVPPTYAPEETAVAVSKPMKFE